MSEFYSGFLFRYQTEAAPRKISINAVANMYSSNDYDSYRKILYFKIGY